jgi:predicted RNA-binding Zn-ribbon protein involved in translation (DUF1610 family)
MSQRGAHPREFVGCPECGETASGAWEKNRSLPQIGQTYACENCGHEVHVYDAGAPGETIKQWRPVTDQMATNLLFFAEVGAWPDSALEDLFRQGLERVEAVDYHMTVVEALSQNEWARRTDRAQPTVSENVSKAKAKLDDNGD